MSEGILEGKVKEEDREVRSQERRVIGQKVKMKVGVEKRGMEIGLDGEGGGGKGKKIGKKEVRDERCESTKAER